MEKRKLLLVAVSAGVFLVIVISASILIFTPKTPAGGTAVSSARPISPGFSPGVSGLNPAVPGIAPNTGEPRPPASLDAADMVRNNQGVQGIQSPPQATAVQETSFYINGEKPIESYTIEKTDGGASAKVVINVPKPSTAAVPDSVPEAPRQTAPAAPRPAAKPAAAAKPVAAPKPAAKPAAQAPAKVAHNDYWVQTGAFTAKVHAEGVKDTLASKGIASIIENREVEGKTWYRVRVGPYTSENEAGYWLSLVKSIDGFADSQIRQTRSVR
jgi:DedD protein